MGGLHRNADPDLKKNGKKPEDELYNLSEDIDQETGAYSPEAVA